MLEFAEVFQNHLAWLRIHNAFVNLQKPGMSIKGKDQLDKDQVFYCSMFELRFAWLRIQLRFLGSLAENCLRDWSNDALKQELQNAINNPSGHNFILSAEEQYILKVVDDQVAASLEINAVSDPFLNLLHNVFQIKKFSAEEYQKLVVQSFSFEANLRIIRDTNAFNRGSVEALLSIIGR